MGVLVCFSFLLECVIVWQVINTGLGGQLVLARDESIHGYGWSPRFSASEHHVDNDSPDDMRLHVQGA